MVLENGLALYHPAESFHFVLVLRSTCFAVVLRALTMVFLCTGVTLSKLVFGYSFCAIFVGMVLCFRLVYAVVDSLLKKLTFLGMILI